MKEKKPQIFNINRKNLEVEKLLEIQSLLNDGEFQKVIDETKNARAKYPNNFFFFTIASIALSSVGKKTEGLNLLKTAVKRFPDEYEVHYHLGKTYEELEQYQEAEAAFKRSYELTPGNYTDARSDCLNDLGIIYWVQGKKEDALEQWKLALIENPNNINAQNNYKEFTNEYGEPAAENHIMDDVFHFQNVQTEKYFKNKDRDTFLDLHEGEKLIALIMETWNNEVAPMGYKLDSLSAAKKDELFKSIEIDFNKEPQYNLKADFDDYDFDDDDDLDFDDDDLDFDDDDLDFDDDDLDFDDMYTIYDCVEKEELLLLPFTLPLLRALGIKQSRIDDLFAKIDEPTDFEEDMLLWAIDVCTAIGMSIFEKKDREKNFKYGLDIAKEELSDEEAKTAIEELKMLFEKFKKR